MMKLQTGECLPRVSGGGPDISFDEWMKLEFPPRKRGSHAKHRPELLLRKAGSWACIGYCQRTKYMAPVFAGDKKNARMQLPIKQLLLSVFLFFVQDHKFLILRYAAKDLHK